VIEISSGRQEQIDALRGHNADYIEIRIEEGISTHITYRGREREDVGRSQRLGGCVRALVKGGWGFVSFNDLTNLRARVAEAVHAARLVGHEESKLAPVEPVVDVVPAQPIKDPRDVPLPEKVRLFDEYNEIIWSASSKIQTSVIRYRDSWQRIWFANTEGTCIEQEKIDLSAVFIAVARENGIVQQAFLSLGSGNNYGVVENRHQEIAEVAQRAVNLLSARPVKGGVYTIIADQKLAGVFVHEAFGHLSESDFVYENPRLQELMVLGKRFGGPHLNILDGAAIPGRRGSYKYDDEGVPAQTTYLIKEGILVGRLHSRETAAKMGERPTGNARALNHRYRPIVRMTNTYIQPGEVSFEDMLADIKEGLYVKESFGGQTSMEMFTFSAGQAFMIRHGRIEEEVRGVNLTGNLFETLANIDAIGNDFKWGDEGGGCGKGEQSPLPVEDGGPHIRIRNVVIGGE